MIIIGNLCKTLISPRLVKGSENKKKKHALTHYPCNHGHGIKIDPSRGK